MHTVFKLNRGIATSTSKYNLAEGPDLKKSIKFLYHKNVCCQNLNENIKIYLICSTLDSQCHVKACMPICNMYVLHFNLSTYVQ